MAGPYYVDIGTRGAWNGRTGLNTTTNCWLGLTGIQHAYNTAVAGEIVYVKGTGQYENLYTVPYDANSGNLTNGEAVTWSGGAGVVQFKGAMATPVKIELTSGAICTDGSVVTGTTSGNTITAHSGVDVTAVYIDTNSGTTAAGYIKFIGCNSSFVVDGTRAILDGQDYAHGLIFAPVDLLWHENIEVKNCGYRSGFVLGSEAAVGCVFVNCSSHDNGSYGFQSNNNYRCTFIRCTAYNNGVHGFHSGYGENHYYFCSAYGNTQRGFNEIGSTDVLIGCIVHNNGDDGVDAQLGALLFNCVVDANSDDGINSSAGGNKVPLRVIGCRVTNHDGSGDIGLNGGSKLLLTGWNYFQNNDGNNVQNAEMHFAIPTENTTTSSNLEDLSNTDCGYNASGSHDFTTGYVNSGDPDMRLVPITIPFTETGLSTYYMTAGLPASAPDMAEDISDMAADVALIKNLVLMQV
jgi:hypothetical protein